MRNTRLEMRLLSGAGGAEISGVDVAQDLDDGTIGEIRDALDRVETPGAARVLVITGAGRGFSAGQDLGEASLTSSASGGDCPERT